MSIYCYQKAEHGFRGPWKATARSMDVEGYIYDANSAYTMKFQRKGHEVDGMWMCKDFNASFITPGHVDYQAAGILPPSAFFDYHTDLSKYPGHGVIVYRIPEGEFISLVLTPWILQAVPKFQPQHTFLPAMPDTVYQKAWELYNKFRKHMPADQDWDAFFAKDPILKTGTATIL